MKAVARHAVSLLMLVLLLSGGCTGARGGSSPVSEETLESRPVDPGSSSLVILESGIAGRGCWGMLPSGWQVMTNVPVNSGMSYRLPVELSSSGYPDAILRVEALPEPESEARVLADASGRDGVALGVFFGGIAEGELHGQRYVAFESYVGSELWRLRFTIRSKGMSSAELRQALYEFVEAIRPGTPARGLAN